MPPRAELSRTKKHEALFGFPRRKPRRAEQCRTGKHEVPFAFQRRKPRIGEPSRTAERPEDRGRGNRTRAAKRAQCSCEPSQAKGSQREDHEGRLPRPSAGQGRDLGSENRTKRARGMAHGQQTNLTENERKGESARPRD